MADLTDLTPLSPREREVVVLLVNRGLGDEAIGRELHISHETVRCHMSSIRRKLGVRTRVSLAMFIIKHPFVVEAA